MDWRRPVFLFLSLVGLSFVLWRMIYSLPFLPSYVVARMLSVLLLSTSSFQILCKTVVFFFSFLFVTWLSFLCSSPFWSDYWEQLATYYAGQLLKLCCQCRARESLMLTFLSLEEGGESNKEIQIFLSLFVLLRCMSLSEECNCHEVVEMYYKLLVLLGESSSSPVSAQGLGLLWSGEFFT